MKIKNNQLLYFKKKWYLKRLMTIIINGVRRLICHQEYLVVIRIQNKVKVKILIQIYKLLIKISLQLIKTRDSQALL